MLSWFFGQVSDEDRMKMIENELSLIESQLSELEKKKVMLEEESSPTKPPTI